MSLLVIVEQAVVWRRLSDGSTLCNVTISGLSYGDHFLDVFGEGGDDRLKTPLTFDCGSGEDKMLFRSTSNSVSCETVALSCPQP